VQRGTFTAAKPAGVAASTRATCITSTASQQHASQTTTVYKYNGIIIDAEQCSYLLRSSTLPPPKMLSHESHPTLSMHKSTVQHSALARLHSTTCSAAYSSNAACTRDICCIKGCRQFCAACQTCAQWCAACHLCQQHNVYYCMLRTSTHTHTTRPPCKSRSIA
jgi:hypothetical protein